jgi:tetratricopeptide (TPR) repeat protein
VFELHLIKKVDMLKKIFLILILFIINISLIYSQAQQSLYQQMIQAFRQLEYENAEKIGKQITADFESYTPIELLETHKILGVIAYQDGNLSEANSQFEQALSIDRTAHLDSVYVSPKIIQFFNDLKSNYALRQKSGEIDKTIHYRYLVQPDPRPAATLRSMILPGWGQLYKNDKRKGYVLVSSTATATLATVLFHFMQKNAHDEYLKATDIETIKQKYDNYNLFYKLRNNTALLAGGIWLYAFFDALLAEPKEKPVKVSFFVGDYPGLYAQFSLIYYIKIR